MSSEDVAHARKVPPGQVQARGWHPNVSPQGRSVGCYTALPSGRDQKPPLVLLHPYTDLSDGGHGTCHSDAGSDPAPPSSEHPCCSTLVRAVPTCALALSSKAVSSLAVELGRDP